MWPREPDGFESATVLPQDPPGDEALYFLYFDGQLVAVNDNGRRRPVYCRELRWLELEIQFEYYLGQYKNQQCFAAQAAGRLPEGYSVGGLRAWLDSVEPPMFYLAGRALQIMAFHETHRFCGRCGAETEYQAEDNARVCPECSHANYPRLSPSIIVLVSRGDEMLLARNARWPNGLYSTLAGFVEPGESVEQTVHREVREEVGLEVKNLRYAGSQSWPFPNSLMLGFHAEYAGGEIVCQPGEIAEARWFRAEQLPGIPPRTAISRWLIDDFIAGRCPKGAD